MKKALVLYAVLALAALLGACGVSGEDLSLGGPGGASAASGGDGVGGLLVDAGAHELTVEPQNPTLDVPAPGTTLKFSAIDSSTNQPVAAAWTSDVATIGSIDASGLFSATGLVGGTTVVTAVSGGMKAWTTLKVVLRLTDNPGNVDPATQAKLVAGGDADPSFRWLYPYDRTVFPRGLSSPTLQFDGTASDAVYVRVSLAGLEYQGFYAASSPLRVDFTEALWKTITLSATGSDKVKVEVTKIAGGEVTGPITETWTIAQGSLKGVVYYDTYDSPAAGGAAIIRIRPGSGAPAEVIHTGCVVCHSVSADGSTLVAGDAYTGTSPYAAVTLDLKNNGAELYRALPTDSGFPGDYSFGALNPDASLMLRNGTTALVGPKTGAAAAAQGIPTALTGLTWPSFSPSGKRIAFMYMNPTATIGALDFDAATNTFSNLANLVASTTGSTFSWPTFTPDSKLVVFQDGNRPDGNTYDWGTGPGNGIPGKGNLVVVDAATKTVARLDAANGLDGGSVYLPFGDEEAHMNYEPSVLPIAVGGYSWVVFDSRRQYGNTINDPNPYGSPAVRKKLWVAALNLGKGEVPVLGDISHPAFYLPSQELESGNQHGSWALDPCKPESDDCLTGDECCSGFCRQTTGTDGGIVFACVPPGGCAQEFEKCTTAADCCGAGQGYLCINGHCAQPPN